MTQEEYYLAVLSSQNDLFTVLVVIGILLGVIFLYLVFRDIFIRRS
jgi:hypothetical protein